MSRWPTWVLRPTVIFAISRAVTLAALAVTTTFSHVGLRGEIDLWDTRWFLWAAQLGYPRHLPIVDGHIGGSTVAFFPVFPAAIRWLAYLTGLSLLTSGIIVSTVTGLTAMVGVWMLVRHYAGDGAADRSTLLLALFPGSFVFSLVYSEGFVITFVAFGLLALMRRRWLLAGTLGLLATATSPVAMAFAVSCAWCAYREIARTRSVRGSIRPLAAVVLAPLGFIGYQLWLWWHTGNLLAWRETEFYGWHSYASLVYPVHLITSFVADPLAATITTDLLVVGTVGTIACAVVAVRSRMPMPVLLYGLTAAFLAAIAAPVGLRPRFVLLAFPLVLAVGTRLRGRAFAVVLAVSTVLLVGITMYTVSVHRVFP